MSLLDEKVRSRLRSGVAIPSMTQCVGELVENAIDASAKCIAVRVDVSKYKIQVDIIIMGGGPRGSHTSMHIFFCECVFFFSYSGD